jgi:hypothetical protein
MNSDDSSSLGDVAADTVVEWQFQRGGDEGRGTTPGDDAEAEAPGDSE